LEAKKDLTAEDFAAAEFFTKEELTAINLSLVNPTKDNEPIYTIKDNEYVRVDGSEGRNGSE
jgi:hypothetical protein